MLEQFFERYADTPAKEARFVEARRRFRILLRLAFAASIVVFGGGIAWLHSVGAELHPAFVGAIFFAIFGTLMLSAALMGLVFFSAVSGVDEDADVPDLDDL